MMRGPRGAEEQEGATHVAEENFRYTSAPERRNRLVQVIEEQGYCTIAELSRSLAVSEMTVRRDVLRLVEEGRVRGFRGGVGLLSRQEFGGSDYRSRDVKMGEAKLAIARRAVAMVAVDSVIAVDAGTTANHVAALLPSDRNTSVVTHSFSVVSSLLNNSGVEVMCLGGNLHQESLSFDGPATLSAISNLHVQDFFLGASAVSERGAFCGNAYDAITKRALIEVSERVVLLADSTKFLTTAMVKICSWEAIDLVVIDDGITEEQRMMLEKHGVDVDVVPVERDPSVLALESGVVS